MKTGTYSSLTAFFAHYLALRACAEFGSSAWHNLYPEESRRLAAMEKLMHVLKPEERGAIESDSGAPGVARHRQRALRKLGRELLARGVIEG